MVLEAYTFVELHKENTLEIQETKLKIELLQIRLERLERRNRIIARTVAGGEQPFIEVQAYESEEEEEEIEVGLSTNLKDKEGDIIRTGDRVRVLTPSKKNKAFKTGSIALVEGVQKRTDKKDYVRIRSKDDPKQRTTRDSDNLKIEEPFKRYNKSLKSEKDKQR